MSIVRGYFCYWGNVPPDWFQISILLKGCLGRMMKKCVRLIADWFLSYFFCVSFWCRIMIPPLSSCALWIRWLRVCYFRLGCLKNIKICIFFFPIFIRDSSVPFLRFCSIALRTNHIAIWARWSLQWSSLLRNSKNLCKWLLDAWKNSLIWLLWWLNFFYLRPIGPNNCKFPVWGITLIVISVRRFLIWGRRLRYLWSLRVIYSSFGACRRVLWLPTGSRDHW